MQYLIELPLINELVQKLFNCANHHSLLSVAYKGWRRSLQTIG